VTRTARRPPRAAVVGRTLRSLGRRGPARRRAVALALLAGLLVGGWTWLRDSSLVAVREVRISGTASADAGEIRAALRQAAAGMTTLRVREDALRAAVREYPAVAGLHVRARLPHRLDIEIVERTPVAAVEVAGERTPASSGGLLLRGETADRLPAIPLASPPAGDRLTDRRTLAALAVAAAAPPRLRARARRLWWGPRGLMLDLDDGPALVFGDRRALRAKWIAAGRVLAEPSAQGATYLDLRVPERVAAGGREPVTPDDETPGETPSANPQP